jgi:tryptophan-rich sensory protein
MGNALALVGFVAAGLVAGAVGGLATAAGLRDWYPALDKPSWNPPGWVFGPVWSVLYVLIGVAAWLVWRERADAAVGVALGVWALQLVLNSVWPWLFFGLHLPGWAFAEILVLWAAIAATIVLFRDASPAAAWLLVPYLAWVSFAALLNGAIWRLNA